MVDPELSQTWEPSGIIKEERAPWGTVTVWFWTTSWVSTGCSLKRKLAVSKARASVAAAAKPHRKKRSCRFAVAVSFLLMAILSFAHTSSCRGARSDSSPESFFMTYSIQLSLMRPDTASS